MDDWDWSGSPAPKPLDFEVKDEAKVGGQFGVVNGDVYISTTKPTARPAGLSGRPRKLIGLAAAVVGLAIVGVVLIATLPRGGKTPHAGTTSSGTARCKASVKPYDAKENKYNVGVSSNQPYTSVEASADDNHFANRHNTNGSGNAVVYLTGPLPGTRITVTVGSATCTATA